MDVSWTIYKTEHWIIDAFEMCHFKEKTLESPLDSKDIISVNPKGNQSWILIGRTDAEAEAPIFWLFDVKRQLIEKDPVAGKDWRQKEKKAAKVDMSGCHHWLNGLEFEQTPGDSEVCGSLLCSSPWGHKELIQLCDWKTTNKTNFKNHFDYKFETISNKV